MRVTYGTHKKTQGLNMIMAQESTIIQANPGFWFLIRLGDANKEVVDLLKKPIIAWRILSEGGSAFPIGVDDDADYEFAILTPDGTVIEIGEGWFDSVDEYVKFLTGKALI